METLCCETEGHITRAMNCVEEWEEAQYRGNIEHNKQLRGKMTVNKEQMNHRLRGHHHPCLAHHHRRPSGVNDGGQGVSTGWQ